SGHRGTRAAVAAALLVIATGAAAIAAELGTAVAVPIPIAGAAQQKSTDRPLPALPQQVIAPHPVHAVPEDAVPTSRPVTFGSAAAARRPAPAFPPRSARHLVQIAGAATPTGAAALRIGDRRLRLFGIRPHATGDRCAASALGAAPLPCAEAADKLLAARLAPHAVVSCRLPAPKRAADAAICLDSTGVDLGGLLVAEGLALADPKQGEDYVGAESIARSNRRGLWRF